MMDNIVDFQKYKKRKEKLRLRELKREKARRKLLRLREKFLIPQIYRDLFGDEAAKYIILKGGRGSGKTFAIVCYLIEESFDLKYENSLFLFLREIQNSIDDSVYSVICDLINQAGLQKFFKIEKTRIRNRLTGVEFGFTGLRSTGGKTQFSQVNKIKGKHKVRYVFMDEAQDASEDSLNVLFPTVNRSGRVKFTEEYQRTLDAITGGSELDVAESRFLFAMNPNFAVDPIISKVRTYGDASRIVHINIFDLPVEFQDKQLLAQALAEYGEIYYDHVWLGKPSPKISGYPFADVEYVEAATSDIDKLPCIAFLDPSFKGGDYTALTFITQIDGAVYAWGYCYHQAWNNVKEEIAKKIHEFNCYEFYYESNGVGSVPIELFEPYGLMPIGRNTSGNKEDRIFRVGAYLSMLNLRFISNWSNAAWLEHCSKYNIDAKYDDAPDSLTNAAIRAGIVSDKMKFRRAA